VHLIGLYSIIMIIHTFLH